MKMNVNWQMTIVWIRTSRLFFIIFFTNLNQGGRIYIKEDSGIGVQRRPSTITDDAVATAARSF